MVLPSQIFAALSQSSDSQNIPAQQQTVEGSIYNSFLQILGGVLRPENPVGKSSGAASTLIDSLGLESNANKETLSILSALSRPLQNLGPKSPPLKTAGAQEVDGKTTALISSAAAPVGPLAQAVELLLNSGFTTKQVGKLYQSIAGIVPNLLENQNIRQNNHGPVEAKNSTQANPILPPNPAEKFANLGEIKNTGATNQPTRLPVANPLTLETASPSTVLSDTAFKPSEDLVIKPSNGKAIQQSLGAIEKSPNPDRLFSAPALKNQPTPPSSPVQLQELAKAVGVTRTKNPMVEKLSFKEGPASRSPTSTSFTPNALGTSEPGTMNSPVKAHRVAPAVNLVTALPIGNPEVINFASEAAPPGTQPAVDSFVSALNGDKAEPIALQPLAREVSAKNIIRQIANQFSVTNSGDKGEIQLKLDPPSLGAVRLRVTTQGDSVRALIVADHHAVKQLIENNLPQLRDAIGGQGLKVESFSVLVGGHSQQENPFGNDEKTFNTFAQNENTEKVAPESEPSVAPQPDYARQSSINIFA